MYGGLFIEIGYTQREAINMKFCLTLVMTQTI